MSLLVTALFSVGSSYVPQQSFSKRGMSRREQGQELGFALTHRIRALAVCHVFRNCRRFFGNNVGHAPRRNSFLASTRRTPCDRGKRLCTASVGLIEPGRTVVSTSQLAGSTGSTRFRPNAITTACIDEYRFARLGIAPSGSAREPGQTLAR